MAPREESANKKTIESAHSLRAAQNFIRLFERIKHPNEDQRTMLATAYYTLATQKKLSLSRSKLHLNAAIALLKGIKKSKRKDSWSLQIAQVYFKRAEILEEKKEFRKALQDYCQVIEVLEALQITALLEDEDLILLTHASISIADLIVSEPYELEDLPLLHPLSYINKALEYLTEISEVNEDIWVIHAYAHQIAAITLSLTHFEESKEAFRIALSMAFKTKILHICPLLTDIYSCLGLLYEQQYNRCPIQKACWRLPQHSTLYFTLSFLFHPNEADAKDKAVLESLFEIIYRALDPYLPPLAYPVLCDLIDALIYTYICVIDNVLPNQTLQYELTQPDTLDTFAQHIYWLVMEVYYKKYPRSEILNMMEPLEINYELDKSEILAAIQNSQSNNVHFLKNLEHIFNKNDLSV